MDKVDLLHTWMYFSNAISNENLLEPIESSIQIKTSQERWRFYYFLRDATEKKSECPLFGWAKLKMYTWIVFVLVIDKNKNLIIYLAYLLRSNSFRDKIVFLAQVYPLQYFQNKSYGYKN